MYSLHAQLALLNLLMSVSLQNSTKKSPPGSDTRILGKCQFSFAAPILSKFFINSPEFAKIGQVYNICVKKITRICIHQRLPNRIQNPENLPVGDQFTYFGIKLEMQKKEMTKSLFSLEFTKTK